MVDNAEKKRSWWLTLPGVLTAMGTFIGAITGLLAILNQVGLISPTQTPAPVTSTGPRPPSGVPLISLPAANADWQGFQTAAFSYARCHDGDPAALIAQTTDSHLVICRAGPNNYYYRGIANHADHGIELLGAVPASGGFDVTNPSDGTEYQVRPDGLTILMPGRPPWSETMLDYTN
jgi:serine/threonine-protein kinase